jgi:hypothetical protein
MNPTIALRVVVASMALVLQAALPAWGANTLPAQTLQFWQCMIQLDGTGLAIPTTVTETKFLTTNTKKQCPGNTSVGGGTASISIQCTTEDPVPGWSGGAKNTKNFPCQIYRPVCGLPAPAFVPTSDSQLSCNSNGICTLKCTASGG